MPASDAQHPACTTGYSPPTAHPIRLQASGASPGAAWSWVRRWWTARCGRRWRRRGCASGARPSPKVSKRTTVTLGHCFKTAAHLPTPASPGPAMGALCAPPPQPLPAATSTRSPVHTRPPAVSTPVSTPVSTVISVPCAPSCRRAVQRLPRLPLPNRRRRLADARRRRPPALPLRHYQPGRSARGGCWGAAGRHGSGWEEPGGSWSGRARCRLPVGPRVGQCPCGWV